MPQTGSVTLGRPFEGLHLGVNFFARTTDSQTKWLIVATVPGFERIPIKKLDAYPDSVLRLLRCWRSESIQAAREVRRMVLGWRAGKARALESYVIHPCVAGFPQTSACQDRSPRYREADARPSWLAILQGARHTSSACFAQRQLHVADSEFSNADRQEQLEYTKQDLRMIEMASWDKSEYANTT